MTSATFVMLSSALTYGVPLALAVRELLTLKPAVDRGGDGPPPPPEFTPAPKPLPECLLPRPLPMYDHRPARVLEDA